MRDTPTPHLAWGEKSPLSQIQGQAGRAATRVAATATTPPVVSISSLFTILLLVGYAMAVAVTAPTLELRLGSEPRPEAAHAPFSVLLAPGWNKVQQEAAVGGEPGVRNAGTGEEGSTWLPSCLPSPLLTPCYFLPSPATAAGGRTGQV